MLSCHDNIEKSGATARVKAIELPRNVLWIVSVKEVHLRSRPPRNSLRGPFEVQIAQV
jgi:hypothetical protein